MKENQDRNIQNVYRQIVEISKISGKKVVLFGSRARGTNMPKAISIWRFMGVQILEVCQIV